MQELIVLSSKGYENDGTTNYGDCIIINTGKDIVVYDCGSKEHANKVISYAKMHAMTSVIGIISHADSDHVEGFHTLHDEGYLSEVYTTLLYKNKYIDKILEYLDDKRRSTESTRKNIEEKYSNISALSGYGLKDSFDDNDRFVNITSGVEIIGPGIDYLIEAVADNIDNTATNTLDGNTLTNAASIIVKVSMFGKTFILNGDASEKSIIESAKKYKFTHMQLSHHGNKDREKLLDEFGDECEYFISDNTGTSNGGSGKIITKGYRCRNTLNGTINYKKDSGERIMERTLGL